MFIKAAELANKFELNINNLNNNNDFNHLIDIYPDRNNSNLHLTVLMQIQVIYCKLTKLFFLMSLNICCLKRKFLNLQLEIADHFHPSVIGIYETKITSETETLKNIAGYNMLTNNNQSNKGLSLYIKNNIRAMVKPEQTYI